MTTASVDGSPEPLGTKNAKPTLYHYWRSSSSWRVRWALMLKGVDFEAVAVNLLRGEQQAADYVAKNPQGLVPLLTVPTGAGGVVQLSESMAILEYLEEAYPQPALLPVDALGRARVRQLAQVIVADTQPLQNLSVLRHISSEPAAQKVWAQKYISRGFDAYEALLAQPGWPSCGSGGSAGRYSYGDSVTMADLCLVPQVYNALRQELDLARWPRLQAVYLAALATEAAQRSAPDAVAPQK